MSDIIKQIKPKITLTKLVKPELTGHQFRIDSVSNITLPYDLPFKSGDVLTSQEVDSLLKNKKYTVIRIKAGELCVKSHK